MIAFLEISRKTRTYEIGKGFMIDIYLNEDNFYEVWLYHKKIGIKDMIFGLPKDTTSYSELIEIIITNLENESYLDDYMFDYT